MSNDRSSGIQSGPTFFVSSHEIMEANELPPKNMDFTVKENNVEKPRTEKTNLWQDFKAAMSKVGDWLSKLVFGDPVEKATAKFDKAFNKVVEDLTLGKANYGTLHNVTVMEKHGKLAGKDMETLLTDLSLSSAKFFLGLQNLDREGLAHNLKNEVNEIFRGSDETAKKWDVWDGTNTESAKNEKRVNNLLQQADDFGNLMTKIHNKAYEETFGVEYQGY